MHIVHCTIQDAHDLVTMFSISGLQAVAMESGKIWTGLGWVGGGGDTTAEIDLSKRHQPQILRQLHRQLYQLET